MKIKCHSWKSVDWTNLKLSNLCAHKSAVCDIKPIFLFFFTAYGSSYLKFDERTVSPLLSLSEDFSTLTFLHKKPRQSPPYDPARFDCWPNALGSLSMSSGTHSWVMDVGQSAAFKVGVCYASLERKGSGNEARLGNNSQSWVLSHYDGDYSFCHAGKNVPLQLVRRPERIGLLLDFPSQTLMFYEPDSSAVLYSVTHQFKAPLVPACAVTDRSITILHWQGRKDPDSGQNLINKWRVWRYVKNCQVETNLSNENDPPSVQLMLASTYIYCLLFC